MADGVSEKPWSEFTKADYSVEQWARACLIHQYQGTPTSKDQCKLPVRTPMGVLSRAGVHAAAAALAGARGGVDATPAEKEAAGKALIRLYGKLNEEAPSSLSHDDILSMNEVRKRFGLPIVEKTPSSTIHMTHDELGRVQAFLSHFGRRGMRWGQHIFTRVDPIAGVTNSSHVIKRDKNGKIVDVGGGTTAEREAVKTHLNSASSSTTASKSDAEQAHAVAAKIKKNGLNSVSNAEMQVLINRMNLQVNYNKLTAQPSKIERGREFFNRQLKTGKTINEMIAFANSPAGKLVFSVMSPTSGRHAVGSRASNRVLTPKRIKV